MELLYNLNKQHCENVTTFQMDSRKLNFDLSQFNFEKFEN